MSRNFQGCWLHFLKGGCYLPVPVLLGDTACVPGQLLCWVARFGLGDRIFEWRRPKTAQKPPWPPWPHRAETCACQAFQHQPGTATGNRKLGEVQWNIQWNSSQIRENTRNQLCMFLSILISIISEWIQHECYAMICYAIFRWYMPKTASLKTWTFDRIDMYMLSRLRSLHQGPTSTELTWKSMMSFLAQRVTVISVSTATVSLRCAKVCHFWNFSSQ